MRTQDRYSQEFNDWISDNSWLLDNSTALRDKLEIAFVGGWARGVKRVGEELLGGQPSQLT